MTFTQLTVLFAFGKLIPLPVFHIYHEILVASLFPDDNHFLRTANLIYNVDLLNKSSSTV